MFTKILKFHFSYTCGSLVLTCVVLVQMHLCDGSHWAVKSLISAAGFNGQIFLHRYPCCFLNPDHCLQISQSFSHGIEAGNFSWCEQCILSAIRGTLWTRYWLFTKCSSNTSSGQICFRRFQTAECDLYGIHCLWLGVWSVWPLSAWVLLSIEQWQ